MSQIIQFAHSGLEWGADHVPRHSKQYLSVAGNPGWLQRSWTLRGAHGRKFVERSGKYVQQLGGPAIPADPLYFWCEAEWATMARPLVMPANAGTGVYPQWLHKFYTNLPERPIDGVNSDPYIFGKQFIYSNCKQDTVLCNTQICPGDLILYGSVKRTGNKPRFMLDTVFVAGEHSCPMAGKTIDEICRECGDRVSESFVKAVLEQLKESGCGHNNNNGHGCSAGNNYTLYFGASFDEPWKEIFSFVPVKIPGLKKTARQEDCGYERLTFTTLPPALNGMLNLNLAQGVRIVHNADSVHVWKEIVKFAIQQGYVLGTYFKEP